MMPAVPGLDCKSVQHTTPALEEQAAESTNVSAALQMLEWCWSEQELLGTINFQHLQRILTTLPRIKHAMSQG